MASLAGWVRHAAVAAAQTRVAALSRPVPSRLASLWARLNATPRGFGAFRRGRTNPERRAADAREGEPSSSSRSSSGSGGGGSSSSGGGGGGAPDQDKLRMLALGIGSTAALALLLMGNDNSDGQEITFQQFVTRLLPSGSVERLECVNKTYVRVHLKPSDNFGIEPVQGRAPAAGDAVSRSAPYYFTVGSVDILEERLEDAQRALGVKPGNFVPLAYVDEVSLAAEAGRFVPTLLLIGAIVYLARRGMAQGGAGGGRNIFSIGKTNASTIKAEDNVGVTFADVAGCDEAKAEVTEFVDFLNNPERYTRLGSRIPKGALLVGPPGTGKTLLAKAVAGEAKVPFLSVSGSDFLEMFVGVGPSRVRDLFAKARASAPCIMFIDEIDAIGRARGRGGLSVGNDERENTLNQMLVEMDGFTASTGVVVLAGTNRADILDSALLRPGRFDRKISVDRPDVRGREQIFNVYLPKVRVAEKCKDGLAARLARLTPGMVGADIRNVVNEAALIAARDDADAIELKHFDSAIDKSIAGVENRSRVISKDEKQIIAVHEAGHAVVGWNLPNVDELLKVTIIPRSSGALGFAQYLPKDQYLYTEPQILDRICMTLGGRAAEEVTFGRVTTGARDDLDKVTKIAYMHITRWGMDETVGNLNFDIGSEGVNFQKPYSEDTARKIDIAAQKLVNEQYERAKAIVRERLADVESISRLLLEREVISVDDVRDLIGPRPANPDDAATTTSNAPAAEPSPNVQPAPTA